MKCCVFRPALAGSSIYFSKLSLLLYFWHNNLFEVFMPEVPQKVKILKVKNINFIRMGITFFFVLMLMVDVHWHPKNCIFYLALNICILLKLTRDRDIIRKKIVVTLSRVPRLLKLLCLHFLVKGVFSPISPCLGNICPLSFALPCWYIVKYPLKFVQVK